MTLFTAIINRELPGRFVWEDDRVVGFLTIAPITTGHTLVVPREEVDHWLDADPSLLGHAMDVAQRLGVGIQEAFRPARVAMLVAGFEVPHMHIHVLGASSEAELKFENAKHDATADELDGARDALRESLRGLGYGAFVPID